jgi:hypothetical protein
MPVQLSGHTHCLGESSEIFWRIKMGKYILGWLLGVPAIVLVIIYLFFN